jgi:hypothetical protein
MDWDRFYKEILQGFGYIFWTLSINEFQNLLFFNSSLLRDGTINITVENDEGKV